jgi:hypothetical protein
MRSTEAKAMDEREPCPSWRWAGGLLTALTFVGCVGPVAGRAIEPPPEGATELAVTTSDAEGLRVLWNGPRRGPVERQGAWLASSQDELVALWRDAEIVAPLPQVDFARYRVFGFVDSDGPCPPEIATAVVDRRVLRLRGFDTRYACESLLVGIAEVVAIPSRIVPRSMVVVPVRQWGEPGRAYAFDVPSRTTPSPPVALPSAPAAATPPGASGVVPMPAAGHIALETLPDGIEVWVVHRSDDSVSVLASTISDERRLRHALQWSTEDGRPGSFDSHGHHVNGDAPLPGYAFRRLSDVELEVFSRRSPDEGGPIEARDRAPVLDGPSLPYASLVAKTSWNDIPDGHVGRFDGAVVFSEHDVPRLCRAPSTPGRFHGCPPDAPRASAVTPLKIPVVFGHSTVVRRRGDAADFLVVDPGYSGYGGR